EHVQLLAPADVPRLGELGVVASMQPIHATSDIDMAEAYWGARSAGAYAWRSLLDAGTVLAFGSDCPVETLDPLAGIHAAATRQRPDGTPPGGWRAEQGLGVDDAVRAYTWGAAYAAGEEAEKGSLALGKVGDLVVLSDDIFRMERRAIGQVRVLATVCGGRLAFSTGDLTQS
ncbi:MAG TPA: amidohydrolase family protein, partial [Anaerolineae bacterium]|nr:amidohydrolase family protein [Anaerolineae bacterium]